MPTPNEAVIARAYDAFHTGDLDAIRNECFAPGIRWTMPGTIPLAGVYDGIDAVLGMFGRLFERSSATFKATPAAIDGFGDMVLVRAEASWTDSTGAHTDPFIQVFRVENGRATACQLEVNTDSAWAAL